MRGFVLASGLGARRHRRSSPAHPPCAPRESKSSPNQAVASYVQVTSVWTPARGTRICAQWLRWHALRWQTGAMQSPGNQPTVESARREEGERAYYGVEAPMTLSAAACMDRELLLLFTMHFHLKHSLLFNMPHGQLHLNLLHVSGPGLIQS